MDWWNVIVFGVIPVLTVVIMFIAKRKMLWTAPLISMVLAFITYIVALEILNPSEMLAFFRNNEYRGFFILAMSMHLGIVVVLTVIAYLIAYILKRKQK
ncbi:MAG: hypothetical protein IJZ23_02410 [Roseburia sp.]|nr:hypothetical protein [Roseburia sp.]